MLKNTFQHLLGGLVETVNQSYNEVKNIICIKKGNNQKKSSNLVSLIDHSQ